MPSRFAPRDSSSSSPCVRAHRSRRSRRPQTRSQRSPPRSPTPIARAIRVTRVSLRFLPRIFSTRVALTNRISIRHRFVDGDARARRSSARVPSPNVSRARADDARGRETCRRASSRCSISNDSSARRILRRRAPGGRDGGAGNERRTGRRAMKKDADR